MAFEKSIGTQLLARTILYLLQHSMILLMRKIQWKKICLLVNHTVLSQKLITAFWFGFGTGDRIESNSETLHSF